MKKTLAVFAFAAMSAMAADWTGYIVDQTCAGKKDDKGAVEDHAACATRCIKGGAPAVLVSDGKIFKIADQDKVTAHAGHKVTITGKRSEERRVGKECRSR